jgi:hypothetical protein
MRRLERFMFGEPEDEPVFDLVPVSIDCVMCNGEGRYVLSFVVAGQTHVFEFSNERRAIVLTKALISMGASSKQYSWEQATFAKEVIDQFRRLQQQW